MDARLLWEARPPSKSGTSLAPCSCVAASPDGLHLTCGIGDRVFVFDQATGTVLHVLKRHKGIVYSVAYSSDGSLIATAGADKSVIVWSASSFEGRVKYSHQTSVQCLAFRPGTQQLASGAATDLGMWHIDENSVTKYDVQSKILALDWTPDGEHFAAGYLDGSVSIRDAIACEKCVVQKDGPVWALAWTAYEHETCPVLIAGCWNGTWSLHRISGEMISEHRLHFFPGFLSSFLATGCFLTGGTDKKVHLLNADGAEYVELLERDTWIWQAVAFAKRDGKYLCLGTGDGCVAMYLISLSSSCVLHGDWLVQREGFDCLSLRHLPSTQDHRLMLKQRIRGEALYENRLAVQVGNEISLYSLSQKEPPALAKTLTIDRCQTVFSVSSNHCCCVEKSEMHAIDFNGRVAQTWALSADIVCISCVGGPSWHEGFLVGCKNGDIYLVYAHNPIPRLVLSHGVEIRCLDLNKGRTKIVAVDTDGCLAVYDLKTQSAVLELREKEIESACWDTRFVDILYYNCSYEIYLLAADFLPVRLSQEGRLVAGGGTGAYVLQENSLSLVQIPCATLPPKYIQAKQFHEAYALACLAAEDDTWEYLGKECLLNGDHKTAKRCFKKLRHVMFLELIERLEALVTDKADPETYMVEVFCSLGRFEDAAACYAQAGKMDKALEVFSNMKMYEAGQRWARAYSEKAQRPAIEMHSALSRLLCSQAKHAEKTQDIKRALEIYSSAGDFGKALDLIEEHNLRNALRGLIGQIDDEKKGLLERCVDLSLKFGEHEETESLLKRLQDRDGLTKFYCSTAQWKRAEELVKNLDHVFKNQVQIAKANWLVQKGEFLRAVGAYTEAECTSKAKTLLQDLLKAKVSMEQFFDAATLYHEVSRRATSREEYETSRRKSELYYAYSVVYDSLQSPFATTDIGTLFNAAHYLAIHLNSKQTDLLPGIRLSNVLYTLFKTSKAVGALRLAQDVCRQLSKFHLRKKWQEEIQLEMLMTRGKEMEDLPELQPTCCRCNADAETLNFSEDSCPHCGNPFVRCFLTFNPLPVIEFQLEDGISAEDAIAAVESNSLCERKVVESEDEDGDVQVFHLDESQTDHGSIDALLETLHSESDSIPKLSLKHLEKLSKHDILISYHPSFAGTTRLFKIIDNSVPLCVGPCGHIFTKDEYTQASLEQKRIPFLPAESREPV